MSSFKGMLFNQFAGDGLSALVEEFKNKYKPKKGRRFNHHNVTYEISRPALKDDMLEFEISCKIPQDEIKDTKAMKAYFQQIKKIMNKGEEKPISIEMENIVWDSKKNTEKERDYVKLLYQYPLDKLYDNMELLKKFEAVNKGVSKDKIPTVPGVFTLQGRLVLFLVQETMKEIGRQHVNSLIKANKQVKN